MHLTTGQLFAIALDIILAALIAVIYRTGERKYIWKTISDLGLIRLASDILSLGGLMLLARFPTSPMRTTYFISFYVCYFAQVGVEYKLFYEVYRKATVPFTGFSRWSKAIFAWIVVVMVVLTLSTIGNSNAGMDFWARAGFNTMRAVETVSVCVAAMLCYLVRSMGMPWRSKVFGIMGGFVLGSIASILQVVQVQMNLVSNQILSDLVTASSYVIFITWIAYAFLPEPLPRPVTLPAESPVYRWSQIASALGTKTQVAVPEPQHSFFLADVEKVVDKVFTRHMQETTDSAS